MRNTTRGIVSLAARAALLSSAAAAVAIAGCAASSSNDGPSVPSRRQGVTAPEGGGDAARGPTRSGPQRVWQLDETSEKELGEAVVLRLTNQHPVVNDARLAEYVNLVGLTVANSSNQPARDFTFGVLDTDDVGLFAAPGGYVLITRGAVRRMRNEAELAGELARGVAHVTARDPAKALRPTGLLNDIDQVATTENVSMRAAAFAEIADAVTDVVAEKGYGPAEEGTAVGEALATLENANYSAAAYTDYLKRLQQQAGSIKFADPTDADDLSTRVDAAVTALNDVDRPGQTLAERFRRYIPPTGPAAGKRPGPATKPAAKPRGAVPVR